MHGAGRHCVCRVSDSVLQLLLKDPRVLLQYNEIWKVAPEELHWVASLEDSVMRSLADVGVLQMEIFLTPGDPLSRLVMIMKTTDAFDPAVDFPRHASSSPTVVEWEARMKAFQTPAPEAEQGEWWSPVERVFDLSAQLASAGARAGYRVPEG